MSSNTVVGMMRDWGVGGWSQPQLASGSGLGFSISQNFLEVICTSTGRGYGPPSCVQRQHRPQDARGREIGSTWSEFGG